MTEPHAELNAGLIVIFRSSHPPLFDWHAWSLRFRSSLGSVTDEELKDEASNLAAAFWDRIGEFLMRTRTASELSPDEKALWIQSGLAVSPLMGTCLQHSLDFCLAWALIGEWTSRVLFPVPKGPWPRHGHAGALLQNYKCRSPRIVAWARAAFEQGALPSLLMMPGLAPVLSLPGDRMFQATEVAGGHQRPAIIHAYGGAKAGMERSLASIAPQGWIPMAAAMLGTVDKPPMWASVGLRPVVGTTIDFRVLPPMLSEREKLLMLSCWQQWDATSVPNSALSQWLVGIDVEHGPDGRSSPTFLKQNFNGQEAADLYQAVHLHTLEDLAEQGPYPKVISQLALRIITYEYPLEAILAIYFLSNGTSLRLCMWKQRDSEVGTSRTLSPGISRSDRIKKGSRSTDLRLLLWKKLCQFRVPSEALKPYRSRH